MDRADEQERTPDERIRVAFFPMHTADDRATGTFCALPAERSASLGIDGRVFLPSSERLYHRLYRRKSRGWQIRAFFYWYAIVFPRRLRQLAAARGYDIIFVQRSMFRWKSLPLLEWLASRVLRKPLVYHMDDGIYLVARRRWSVWRCRLASRVVTGNEQIAEFARGCGGQVEMIEYALDAAAYPVREHGEHEPVVIGYIGIYPEEHLAPVAAALASTCRATGARVKVVGGLRRPDIGELEPFLDWSPWDSTDEASNLADFDIGIMPLADTELHRTKEPLKIKEYMAAGLPIVASPVGHNVKVVREGESGYFAATPEEWHSRLSALVTSASLRGEMGRAGRSLVLERYDLSRLLEELAGLFHRLAARPGPSGRAAADAGARTV
jgi:glycosyltransferase involved in cell wall biosynthesis